MPHIYAIANTKGGVGKSTLAVNLAVVATAKGHKALLVDADPQASSLQFLNARDDTRPKFAGIQLSQPILHKQLPEAVRALRLRLHRCRRARRAGFQERPRGR